MLDIIKTYKKFPKQQKRIVLLTDTYPKNPRDIMPNLGMFYTWDNHVMSPDKNPYPDFDTFVQENLDEPLDDITLEKAIKAFEAQGETLLIVSKYEHGLVKYFLKENDLADWDLSRNYGVYYVPNHIDDTKLKTIRLELEEYTHYVNGDVYQVALLDKYDKIIECTGEIYTDNLEQLTSTNLLVQHCIEILTEDHWTTDKLF